ncbi:Rho termination factor N-terminal domain-containing protein, partial [Tsukamurella soli]|uniref:Rho termination factor N-terminal domain-containing protein n=1 Tax=Tsukamurella soli TaxID=644556 RepID=UPI0031EE4AAB
MTETDLLTSPAEGASAAPTDASARRADERRRSGLNGMVLAELRAIAADLGIKGISGMRKGDLIGAITAQQGGEAAPAATTRTRARRTVAARTEAPEQATLPVQAPADGASAQQP